MAASAQTGKSPAVAGEEMSDGAGSRMGVVGALSLSVTSSVSIVICNKYLISTLGFFFATTLTSWHLMVTFFTLYVAQRLRFFEPKPIDTRTVISFGLLNGISIGLLNLCLGFNSVGFYQASKHRAQYYLLKPKCYLLASGFTVDCFLQQMTKLAIIPFTIVLETIFLNKKFSESIKASLMVLLLGVGIASVTDLQLNFLGSVIAVLTIAATCVGQIKRLKVSSTQLLYQSSPYQSAVLLVTGPFVDKLLTKRDVFAFNYTVQVVAFIALSCAIAVCVNFSTFLVIGTTSPVTYQVLGHLKTCLVLSFGYIILKDPFSYRNVAGILIAIFGMGLYSYYSVSESKKKTEVAGSLPVITQMIEKDSDPLLGAKGSPRPENKAEESFDYMPRTAKSAFTGR
ncbi:putative membrane protein [Dichanthelium oligosanthes]|uniref:Putative membrane protein n=1 Tax=Dichanthelium oligosanthes TaxID=888268 RepID=A0A1E5UW49_9POAL|nr:putative membrane protein [Dichanthelium oligosanthes]